MASSSSLVWCCVACGEPKRKRRDEIFGGRERVPKGFRIFGSERFLYLSCYLWALKGFRIFGVRKVFDLWGAKGISLARDFVQYGK
jgi:hypothetical protein